MKAICNAVPQGSILGPLLLLVYINDFPNARKVFNFLMYADDTTLYCCLEDINSDKKEQVLNNEMQRVHSWLNANKLSLNVRKTKYIIFRKYKNNDIGEQNLRISNDTFEYVNEFNFLGLHLTLSYPGYLRQLITIRGGFKRPPPPTISKTIVSIFTISYMRILPGVLGMLQLEFFKNSRF